MGAKVVTRNNPLPASGVGLPPLPLSCQLSCGPWRMAHAYARVSFLNRGRILLTLRLLHARYKDLIHSLPVHVDNLEPMPRRLEHIARHRDSTDLQHHQPPERLITPRLLLRQLWNLQHLFQIIDLQLAVDE